MFVRNGYVVDGDLVGKVVVVKVDEVIAVVVVVCVLDEVVAVVMVGVEGLEHPNIMITINNNETVTSIVRNTNNIFPRAYILSILVYTSTKYNRYSLSSWNRSIITHKDKGSRTCAQKPFNPLSSRVRLKPITSPSHRRHVIPAR